MSAIIWSWPWYDRAIAGAFLVGVIYTPYIISKQLAHIIKLLERANDLEFRRQRPDLFD